MFVPKHQLLLLSCELTCPLDKARKDTVRIEIDAMSNSIIVPFSNSLAAISALFLSQHMKFTSRPYSLIK